MLVLGVVSGLVKGETRASLTSSASGADNPFTGGSIILSAGETSGTLSTGSLGLGKSYQTIVTVQNAGANNLRYALSIAVTGGSTALANTLQLSITDGPIVAGACTGNTVMAQASLNGGGFGDAATGAQAGDRTLNPGDFEMLCFNISN